MSAVATPVKDLRATSSTSSDDLWHIPANAVQEVRAAGGLSWRTLCGERRPPARETKDWDSDTPDDCSMCVALDLGDL